MGINHSVRSVADGARFRLSQLGGDGTVYVHATYRPARFPFLWVFLVFCIFGLFAIAYEGAAPLRSQRSFLSVTFITAAWFIWLCEGGMSIDDSIGTIWMRFAYAMAIGAVLGSLLPVMAGWMLPELEPPARESEEDVEEDGEDEEDRDAP